MKLLKMVSLFLVVLDLATISLMALSAWLTLQTDSA